MDFKKLGNFLLLAGFIALGVAGYFLYSVNDDSHLKQRADAAGRKAWGSSSGFVDAARLDAKQEMAESKSLVFGSVGGLLILIGLGISFSSKEGTAASKKCPYCAELVMSDATTCRFCKKDFPPMPIASVSGPVETKPCPNCREEVLATSDYCMRCNTHFSAA